MTSAVARGVPGCGKADQHGSSGDKGRQDRRLPCLVCRPYRGGESLINTLLRFGGRQAGPLCNHLRDILFVGSVEAAVGYCGAKSTDEILAKIGTCRRNR